MRLDLVLEDWHLCALNVLRTIHRHAPHNEIPRLFVDDVIVVIEMDNSLDWIILVMFEEVFGFVNRSVTGGISASSDQKFPVRDDPFVRGIQRVTLVTDVVCTTVTER